MKGLHTKKFLGKKSISDAAIPGQSQIKSRPFVVNSASQGQEKTRTPKKAKQQGFNFAEIPVFSGMKPAISTQAASSEIRRMPTQGDVVQCAGQGKERADLPSAKEEDNSASVIDRAAIHRAADALLEEHLTAVVEEVTKASDKELTEIGSEGNSSLAPIANHQRMLDHRQEQPGLSTNSQDSSQNQQEGSSEQSSSQDVQQEEDKRSSLELLAPAEQMLAKLDSMLPPQSESQLQNLAATLQQQGQQPQQPPAPNFSRPLTQQRQQQQQSPIPPLPLTPKQEAQRLLPMDYTAREQVIRDLQQQKSPDFVDLLIEELGELDRQQAAIRGLEGRIPPQGSHQEQPSETRMARIRKRLAKPFDATKEPRKEAAAASKQYEPYSDQTKILGQDSTHTNIDQIGRQNLPANDKDSLTALNNLPTDTPKKFGNDAAVIGMTKDEVKAFSGLLVFSDSLKGLRDALSNKKKQRRQRIAQGSDSTGNLTSAVTYTTLVGTQAQQGVSHHLNQQGTTAASGAIAAAKQGGKLGGTSIPIDVGKAAASVLTTVPKLINYTDDALKAANRENFGGRKSMGRGVKNIADLTKSAAGAVKDISSLVQNAGAVGAEGAKIIAGGAVAPAAHAVVGSAEAIQGSYKFRKGYKNYKGLDEIETEDTDTIDKLKQIQKKKMKRAAIKATLGNVTMAAGIVGFTAGPPGLIAATAIGASVGAFQLGQWGTRKFKQKMRDKGVRGFDNTKSTEDKNQVRGQLAENTLAMLEGPISDEAKETIFSSIGLNENRKENKKDTAVQQVYNDVLAQYLGAEELQQPTNTVNQILKLKGDKNNLKKEVSWDKLSHGDFPADFREQVKKAAIKQALNKR